MATLQSLEVVSRELMLLRDNPEEFQKAADQLIRNFIDGVPDERKRAMLNDLQQEVNVSAAGMTDPAERLAFIFRMIGERMKALSTEVRRLRDHNEAIVESSTAVKH